MAKFFADWRNPGLIVTIIGTLVFGYMLLTGNQAFSPTVITVGMKSFTEHDVVKELKDRAGYPVVNDLITAELLQQYAASHDITVTDSDVDQLVDMNYRQSLMRGTQLSDVLADQGMTMATFRKMQYRIALQTKVLLSPDEMKTAVAQAVKQGPPFIFPACYIYRMFSFSDEATANLAASRLADHTDDSLNRVVADSLNQVVSKQKQMLVAGSSPQMEALFKKLQPGECSKPLPATVGDATTYTVIQYLEFQPAFKATYENCNIAAGFNYWQKNMRIYSARLRAIEGQVLSKTDMQFTNTDYDNVKDFFKHVKETNPVIPRPTAPTAGQPGQVPTPRAPSPGKR